MSWIDWEELTLVQKVAQMVVVRASGHLFDHQIEYPAWEPTQAVLRHYIEDLGVGGVILLGGTAVEVGLRSQQLQHWSTIPLLMAADIEEGVGQRFAGATRFPPPMALGAMAQQDLPGAIAQSHQMGSTTAEEAIAIGLNWILAPIVDVNNNPDNPVINIRAWGETSEQVSQLTHAFIQGAQQHPVLTTAKHFPGHGDTAIDSHLTLPVIPHDATRLEAVELPPFLGAIATGVDAVMTAHLQIPAWDADYPATLSRSILTGQLRQQMGFNGLIVTDALIMGAITQHYGAEEAAVLAVAAGADIVLMPADPEASIAALVEAIETGRIPLEQIHASLERIWQAKHRVCSLPISGDTSHAWEHAQPDPVQLEALARPEAIASVTTILQASMQVHRPPISRLEQPSNAHPLRNLVILDDALNCPFLARQAPAIALPQYLGYHLRVLDSYSPKMRLDPDRILFDRELHPETPDWQPTLLQLFIRSNPFRVSSGLTDLALDWLKFLLQTEQLQAVVFYGTPYVLDRFLPLLPAHIPYVFTYGQMEAAQAIALNTLWGKDLQPTSDSTFTD
ncbi:MAG: beta-glucosidase [Oculatellaceae cyanobacterium Prado106]|nr:beta-glucosidase [Oculatellaceae cyanobacterium Prado106]